MAYADLIATETVNGSDSIRVYYETHGEPDIVSLVDNKKSSFDNDIMCLKFGRGTMNQDYLVAGFGTDKLRPDGSPSEDGYLGLWRLADERTTRLNVSPNSQQVFDIAWSNGNTTFLTGNSKRRWSGSPIASSLRLYSATEETAVLQVDCEAADINKVGFCKYDEQVVSAACTNGTTYLYDLSRPSKV